MYSSMYNCTSDTSSYSFPDHAVLMLISDTNSGHRASIACDLVTHAISRLLLSAMSYCSHCTYTS